MKAAIVGGEPLDGQDVAAINLDSGHKTRDDAPSTNVDSTGTTLPVVTALLRAG
jgi:hypothetical protein